MTVINHFPAALFEETNFEPSYVDRDIFCGVLRLSLHCLVTWLFPPRDHYSLLIVKSGNEVSSNFLEIGSSGHSAMMRMNKLSSETSASRTFPIPISFSSIFTLNVSLIKLSAASFVQRENCGAGMENETIKMLLVSRWSV